MRLRTNARRTATRRRHAGQGGVSMAEYGVVVMSVSITAIRLVAGIGGQTSHYSGQVTAGLSGCAQGCGSNHGTGARTIIDNTGQHGANAQSLGAPVSTDNLLGYYALNEGSGSTAYSSGGTTGDAVITGGVTKNGNYYTFDGTGAVNLGVTAINTSTRLAMGAWVNTTAGGTSCAFCAPYNMYLGLVNGKLAGYDWGRGQVVDTGVVISDGKWHYLAESTDGTSGTIYLDGTIVWQGPYTPTGLGPNGPNVYTAIGSDGGFAQNWIGSIGEVAAYTAPLTASQVAQNFAAGRP